MKQIIFKLLKWIFGLYIIAGLVFICMALYTADKAMKLNSEYLKNLKDIQIVNFKSDDGKSIKIPVSVINKDASRKLFYSLNERLVSMKLLIHSSGTTIISHPHNFKAISNGERLPLYTAELLEKGTKKKVYISKYNSKLFIEDDLYSRVFKNELMKALKALLLLAVALFNPISFLLFYLVYSLFYKLFNRNRSR